MGGFQLNLKTVIGRKRPSTHLFKRHPFCTGADMSGTPQRIGYMRVSTPSQSIDRQALGLRHHCDELRFEHVSAAAKTRPVFEEVLIGLNENDTFVVWDLDRAFRSTVDAILTSEKLRSRGVHFKIVSMHVDTATPEGELFYTVMAGFAQYERRIISRRTREGMEAAKRKGKHIGRPSALTPQTIHDAYAWIIKTNYPCRYVAALLGVSRITLQRGFRRQGLTGNVRPTSNFNQQRGEANGP